MRPETSETYLVTARQTLLAARRAGLAEEDLKLSGIAVLTFSRAVMHRLEELGKLKDAAWIAPAHHPYAAARVVKRGAYHGLDVTVLVPPMGASPLACIVEDLVACGIEAVFLLCAAWSLGPPVEFGELIVPTFSIGHDGTSIHYGNTSGHVTAEVKVVEALVAACRERGVVPHQGGNVTCEAMYRVTPQMAAESRRRGCLCMDNGEASTLFALSRSVRTWGGVVFQPYIDLEQGWKPAHLEDGTYCETSHLQAEVILEAAVRLLNQGRTG